MEYSGHHDCLLHLLKVSAIILQETSDLKARDSIHEVGKKEELSTIRHHVKKGHDVMRSPSKGTASFLVGRLLTWKTLASITIFLIFLLEWKRFNQMMLQLPKDHLEDSIRGGELFERENGQ